MHEKILIPPAVHDEPHFAKKTLVLAVLLSATSMFATAASVNVVTGQTYQDDVDVKAPDTFTNAGTVKNQTITVAGSSKAAFHNTGIIETGTLTLDGIQGLARSVASPSRRPRASSSRAFPFPESTL